MDIPGIGIVRAEAKLLVGWKRLVGFERWDDSVGDGKFWRRRTNGFDVDGRGAGVRFRFGACHRRRRLGLVFLVPLVAFPFLSGRFRSSGASTFTEYGNGLVFVVVDLYLFLFDLVSAADGRKLS